jgi:hypothetical protein
MTYDPFDPFNEVPMPQPKVVRMDNLDNLVKIVPDTQCWEWQLAKNKQGYGTAESTLAHRVVYRWFKGEPPKGLDLMHTCHNPACVNPNHLIPGTRKQNLQMSIEANRYNKALRSEKRKAFIAKNLVNGFFVGKTRRFSDGQVLGIRRLVAFGINKSVLGASLGVTEQAINAIAKRKAYRYVL